MTEQLWCLHIPGPDAVFAAPSKDEAEQLAAIYNKSVIRTYERLKAESTPQVFDMYPTQESMTAVVAEWPWSAHSHNVGCGEWEKHKVSGLDF